MLTEYRLKTRELHGNKDDAPERSSDQAPILLRGGLKEVEVEDLLAALPPRPTADALVLRCLDSGEASLILMHPPTFKDEYEQFWRNPAAASRAWLSLLFGILACAVWIEHSMNPEIGEAKPPDVFNCYREQCALALISSNCTTPGRYKVEAALMYLGNEYLQSNGLKTEISILVGIVSRLAIMMGYHRDSRIYPQLSPFEGEMRRRMWLILSTIDYFVSWQAGLPTVIPKDIGDTTPPRILLDEDFGPTTEVLPPSRSEAHTPSNITYSVALERILSVANGIAKSSEAQISPERTLHLKKQLDAVWSQVPSYLKPSAAYATDGNDGIHILTLEMTYQRARCTLHRQYLAPQHDIPPYKDFRLECVNAARRVLECQTELFQGILSQPQYRHQAWFGISRSICDCMTAAMVICLEIVSCVKKNEPLAREFSTELIGTLKTSYHCWKSCPRPSPETVKAADILARMLRLMGCCGVESGEFPKAFLPTANANVQHAPLLNQTSPSLEEPINSSFGQQIPDLETYTNFSAFDMINFVSLPLLKKTTPLILVAIRTLTINISRTCGIRRCST
ncbi:hypothetical protein BO70DRAFT_419729 [Aspergillus heteromorphus CBS 117.55]|uniref:Xylanolytic transcriptional activator regulatory domain-containing protein n=1 Tax=Aspergillus heteromorphus CBS 117.55 TaxID=1448321 RepID=A0A317WP04_9EURO|nr:uncharacterized protein BO70DRAFT_419729 [Aspergillus heteromorphus CBS 117.55]PWY88176.1 hypothetical protein BO70DRAFT_419729 [Aspergillus heteromorphus CBS 117.55]